VLTRAAATYAFADSRADSRDLHGGSRPSSAMPAGTAARPAAGADGESLLAMPSFDAMIL